MTKVTAPVAKSNPTCVHTTQPDKAPYKPAKQQRPLQHFTIEVWAQKKNGEPFRLKRFTKIRGHSKVDAESYVNKKLKRKKGYAYQLRTNLERNRTPATQSDLEIKRLRNSCSIIEHIIMAVPDAVSVFYTASIIMRLREEKREVSHGSKISFV